jgi:crossover junction endodeoxyribonuclease RuvC
VIVVGVDPGKSGGIAAVGGEAAIVFPMPESSQAIFGMLFDLTKERNYPVHVFMEKSQPMPKQGVSSVYSYGHHNGFIEGCLTALKIPYTLIKPQAWQRTQHVGTDSKLELKARSVQACQRLFPSISLLPTSRCRKPSDGMAEALLIAEHGRRVLQGAAAP